MYALSIFKDSAKDDPQSKSGDDPCQNYANRCPTNYVINCPINHVVFFLFDSLRPINNLSVKQGRVFLG